MKERPAKEFTWYTQDERLLPVLAGIRHPAGERRHYGVHEFEGKKVFVKSFSEKGVAGRIRQMIAPRGKKEFTIAKGLCALGIPAPVALGYAIGDSVSAVAELFIEGKSLLEHIKEDATGREGLLKRLADLLLLLKDKKVRHDDLHLDNILVSGDTLYLVDLHKVHIKRSFSGEDEVTNLTHALGIIYNDITKHERDIFFDHYRCLAETRRKTEDAIERLRARWIASKMERAFRDTSVIRREGDRVYIRGAGERAAGAYSATIKEDRKIKVERFTDHVRKTYTGRARLKRAWENHVVIEYLHMPVAPKAFCAFLPSGARGYIAMEDLKGEGEELDRFLDRNYDSMTYGERKAFVDSLAAFFLHAMTWDITHRDLKACNVFVVASGGFRLLDVEDIRFKKVTGDALGRAFLQLCNTVPKRVSTRDRMRFFLRLAGLVDIDKKTLLREVRAGSLKEPIVYEGASGLVVDKW